MLKIGPYLPTLKSKTVSFLQSGAE